MERRVSGAKPVYTTDNSVCREPNRVRQSRFAAASRDSQGYNTTDRKRKKNREGVTKGVLKDQQQDNYTYIYTYTYIRVEVVVETKAQRERVPIVAYR